MLSDKVAPLDKINIEVISTENITRILHEIKNLLKNPHEAFDIFPSKDNITFWQIIVTGPNSTPYANGTWLL